MSRSYREELKGKIRVWFSARPYLYYKINKQYKGLDAISPHRSVFSP